ncbi:MULTISPECIES: hypothetical protein [unclassified Coleofasciculus]|uniref:hypothetical protein n=1 Tax=unclassified Coleofasciculus TaxID=2692782 RepID=UPI0018805089|nr:MULTISPECIES: hypothetical protein [unclassified Coleofasciculus]MBE9126345.1 hypothetical protein [Coleofasciculus sp. LEGE 07081]MBE9147478.1 hypothetical protein [Coleofasciculus sp. LEGE 07092]
MSPSVNRFSDSPQSSGETPPETSSVHSPHPAEPIGDSQNATNSAITANSTGTMPLEVQRQQPIPPPSEPMQYRAIGLIQGQYMPSADQLTRGTLLSSDGTLIDAVLLGRVMSLVKNHLDLTQSHLWVVYPRTRQEDGNLHVQIVGVWEPETLNRESTESTSPSDSEEAPLNSDSEESSNDSQPDDLSVLQTGYFSIRGQVIYQSRENGEVVVKIKQSPRKESDRTKFFKLTLKGLLGDKAIRHFWDLHVKLLANDLLIEQGNDIGPVPMQKFSKNKFQPHKRSKPRNFKNQRPIGKGEPSSPSPKRSEPLPKPIKRKEQQSKGGASGNSS